MRLGKLQHGTQFTTGAGLSLNRDLESEKESLLENQSKCLESVIHYVGGVTAPACVKAGVKLVSEVEGGLREGSRLCLKAPRKPLRYYPLILYRGNPRLVA